MIFKCKSCGGNTVYSPEKRQMVCPFCDGVETAERVDAAIQDVTAQEAGAAQAPQKIRPRSLVCPNCAGQLDVRNVTAATKCPYCDNYLIIDDNVEKAYEPKYTIRFRMGKDACKDLLRKEFKKRVFAPTDFLSEAKLDCIRGTYVPFWFYSFSTNYKMSATATRVRTHRHGNHEDTETSFYDVYRDMDIAFEKIPVDASLDMPDDIMDQLEPFNYQDLESFTPEVLSGFYADRYHVTDEEELGRAQNKAELDAQQIARNTITGYNTVSGISGNMSIYAQMTEYGLLPVWKYDYSYGGKEYPFYVNGQNGRIVGTLPVSKAKVFTYSLTLWAALTLGMCLVNGILGLL